MPDALLPPEMARKCEEVGVRKVAMPLLPMSLLALLGGAFVGLGAAFATVAWTGAGDAPYGWGRVFGGLCFSMGLGLVVVGGAELFTGNNLSTMAWASRRVGTAALLRSWGVVYVGNAVGAVGTALLVALSGAWRAANGAVGKVALDIALGKCGLDPFAAFVSGVLCNCLVCLAVWLSFSARSTTERLLAVALPIAAFVALGFEHSIANLYFVSIAALVRELAPTPFWTAIGRNASDYAGISTGAFLLRNLLPVTLGNVVGGAGLVAGVYWGIYLKHSPPTG